jgi:dienelactone hydrolase
MPCTAMLRKRRFIVLCVALCFLVEAANEKIVAQSPVHSIHTIVKPLVGEDVARPCEYDMVNPSSGKKIRAVFVVFERGPGSVRFYNDPDIRSFADKHELAMMMPRHCSSKAYEDMDIDPSKGLGRALFAALDQFSIQTDRPELRTAPVILLGFSAAGAFAARLVGFAPQRIAAAVLSHAGQDRSLGLDTIQLADASLTVPELVIVGGKDQTVGTELSYAYFHRYWKLGAPWLFATQNDVEHCCTSDAKDLVLVWLDAVLKSRLQKVSGGLAPIHKTDGYYGFFRKDPTGVITSDARSLTFQRSDSATQDNVEAAGYLPSRKAASEWLRFADRPAQLSTSLMGAKP